MKASPLVSVIMGSQSDWDTMREAVKQLELFSVEYESLIISAHRTPKRLFEFAQSAQGRGVKVIIAGAGGAAHLPGMVASLSPLPVLGVPIQSQAMMGKDSLYSIVQMPAGVPVGCLAIGKSGAKNAALLAVRILAIEHVDLAERLDAFHAKQTHGVALHPKNEE